MKIWTKFIGSSVIVAGLIAALMGGSAYLLKRAEDSAENSRNQTNQAINISLYLDIYLKDQVIVLKDFLFLDHNASDMTAYQKAMSNFLVNLEKLESLTPDIPQLKIVRRRHQFLVRLANSLTNTPTSLSQSQQDIRAINCFAKDIKFTLEIITDNLKQQDALARRRMTAFQSVAKTVTQVIILIILWVFFTQFLLILLPLFRSIQKLQVGAATIGAGNLDFRLNIQTKDEIEQLANEFNQMAEKLAEFYNSLEQKVSDRTAELIAANQTLETEIEERKQVEKALRSSEEREREKAHQLEQTLQELKKAQLQLIQTEKMSSLGQLVAGIAHEINNPVNFIHGNINHLNQYIDDLLALLFLYQKHHPNTNVEIHECAEAIDLEFLLDDLSKLLSSMKVGTERIRQIVLSLRNFSRLDEAAMKTVNIHEGIESSLLILQNRFKVKPGHTGINIIKEYGNLPLISCYAGQLNQVFINILTNAIDALEELSVLQNRKDNNTPIPSIKIRTEVLDTDKVVVRISDNGKGMTAEVKNKIFDPFFTTKPVGKGTGLGLSVCYQIIAKHDGTIRCESEIGQGSVFIIEIPVKVAQNTSIHSTEALT